MRLNQYLDHTLLRPNATDKDIMALCDEANEYDLYSVMVNPVFVPLAVRHLAGSGVKIGSVAGFPLGAGRTDIKTAECRAAENDGAHEIDVVANIGWIESGRFSEITEELSVIKQKLAPATVLKVIIETPLMKLEKLPETIEAVIASGADFVKSATGFFGPTPPEHTAAMARLANGRIRVKAAGGIKTAGDALAMIEAGADRLGSSSSVNIMHEFESLNNM